MLQDKTLCQADNAKVIEKIPLFRGLSHHQVQQILKAGKLKAYGKGKFLFKDGAKSTEMYVVLAGELTVREGAVELARIQPVEIVGEMGVITSPSDSATRTVRH